MDDRVIYCKVDQESCECVRVNRVQLHVMRWMMIFNWLAAEGSCNRLNTCSSPLTKAYLCAIKTWH